MKLYKHFAFLTGLVLSTISFAQVAPNPTCNGQGSCSTSGSYTNLSGPSMGSYSCLGSTPNPSWVNFTVSTNGSIHLQLTQVNNNGNPIDVDFALYGPYTSVSAGCAVIGPGTSTVDCSFSASATEYVDISNAQAGQVYILLITNYNGSAGTITLQQSPNTPSSGSIGCQAPFSATTSQTPATCGQPTGTATGNPVGGFPPFSYSWNDPGGQTTQTATGLTPGQYTVTITSSPNPANGTTPPPATANVTVFNLNATFNGTTTPASCVGNNNGTATANFTLSNSAGVTATYLWNDPAGQTTQTATGLAPGAYSCAVTLSNGCTGTVNVNVGVIPAMSATITSQTDATCYTIADGTASVGVTQGTAPYQYSWTSPSSSVPSQPSSSNTISNLAAGTHTVTVIDANGCTTSQTVTISQPDPLEITFLSPDVTICREDSTQLSVQGTGGSTAYTFSWTENGAPIGTGTSIYVNPENSGTVYCVTLSEACGSPTTNSCMTVTFPTDIVPSIVPDRYQGCQPATFEFSNNSNNPNEIATTYLVFGNGFDTLVQGAALTSSTYEIAQKYSLEVIITSVYGCVYSGTFTDLVEATVVPTANFSIAPNPTTIFETSVQMQNGSDQSIIDWQWFSPGSTPSISSLENPVFHFPEGIVGEYEIMLIGSTIDGCVDTIYKTLTVNSDIVFYAPNAFTPDGDEFNQSWKLFIDGIDPMNFNLKIYNRWGQIIWESNDPTAAWDGTYHGTIVPAGAYIWRAMVKDIYSDKKKEYQGNVNIIR